MDWPLHHLHHPHPKTLQNLHQLLRSQKKFALLQTSIQVGESDFFPCKSQILRIPPPFPGLPFLTQLPSRFTSSQCNCDANVSLSRNPAPVQRNASPFLHDISFLCKSLWNRRTNWHATRPWKVTFPQRQGHIGTGFEHLRTVADGCQHENNVQRTQLYPQTPKVKREPFATHSGKKKNSTMQTRGQKSDCRSWIENPHRRSAFRLWSEVAVPWNSRWRIYPWQDFF